MGGIAADVADVVDVPVILLLETVFVVALELEDI
jgi:hypothetical protein